MVYIEITQHDVLVSGMVIIISGSVCSLPSQGFRDEIEGPYNVPFRGLVVDVVEIDPPTFFAIIVDYSQGDEIVRVLLGEPTVGVE